MNGVTAPIWGGSSEYRRRLLYSVERSRGLGPRCRLSLFQKQKSSPPVIAISAMTPPTAPPMMGARFVLDEDAVLDESVPVAPAEDSVLEGPKLVVSVSFRVVDAHFVNVLLFVTARSFCIVCLKYVLKDPFSVRGERIQQRRRTH